MTEWELIDKIGKEFMDTIYSTLPKDWISSNGSSAASFHARLDSHNKAYKSSEYFYEGEKKFVHWTTIQHLMSIINSRQIRLYNLQNSADPEEFNYSASLLTIPNEQIEHSKNYLYTFSFSENNEKDNPELWEKYGQNYSGISLEFEILNDPEEWDNFMLSRTYYKLPDKFFQLFQKLDELKSKYPGIEIDIDLGKLIAYHKKPNFSNEKEIRLSSYFPYDNIEAYWKNCNTEFRFDHERPRIADYFGLYLWVNNESPYVKSDYPAYDRKLELEEDYFIKKPKIKITNICFGEECGVSNTEYYNFKEKLEEIIRLKLGYHVHLPLNLYKKH
jgi:hypothetical protein